MTRTGESGFSHLDDEGRAQMVDISAKKAVRRSASAACKINLLPQTLDAIKAKLVEKGDVLSVARIAGITAAKRTSDLIPLCHNIAIDQVRVDFSFLTDGIEIRSHALCTDKTGIAMEALTAVSVAALTIYDMCKAIDKQMSISDIRLIEKKKEEV